MHSRKRKGKRGNSEGKHCLEEKEEEEEKRRVFAAQATASQVLPQLPTCTTMEDVDKSCCKHPSLVKLQRWCRESVGEKVKNKKGRSR
jgi:hypothetical protein